MAAPDRDLTNFKRSGTRLATSRRCCVFGQAAQKPFGTLHHKQKLETGEIALRKYHDDR